MNNLAVVITIYDANKMNKSFKKNICGWLHKQGLELLRHGHLYGKKCSIRYYFKG